MKQYFENITESEIGKVIELLVHLDPKPEVITLEGDLGTGKTTLVKKLVAAYGSTDAVSSPTFSLLNEYQTRESEKIHHSDWYRVKDIAELYDAGMDEYIGNGELFIVEWPEIGQALLNGARKASVLIEHQAGGRNYLVEYSE